MAQLRQSLLGLEAGRALRADRDLVLCKSVLARQSQD